MVENAAVSCSSSHDGRQKILSPAIFPCSGRAVLVSCAMLATLAEQSGMARDKQEDDPKICLHWPGNHPKIFCIAKETNQKVRGNVMFRSKILRLKILDLSCGNFAANDEIREISGMARILSRYMVAK